MGVHCITICVTAARREEKVRCNEVTTRYFYVATLCIILYGVRIHNPRGLYHRLSSERPTSQNLSRVTFPFFFYKRFLRSDYTNFTCVYDRERDNPNDETN